MGHDAIPMYNPMSINMASLSVLRAAFILRHICGIFDYAFMKNDMIS